jgi:hypothetical protein
VRIGTVDKNNERIVILYFQNFPWIFGHKEFACLLKLYRDWEALTVFGIPTVFHKSVHKLFSKAAKGVCSIPTGLRAVPASIGNDMRVVYVREIIKEKTNSTKVCFSTAAKSINDNTSAGKRHTSALIKRVLGKHGPKP